MYLAWGVQKSLHRLTVWVLLLSLNSPKGIHLKNGETVMLEKNFKKREQDKFKQAGWIIIQLIPGSGVPQGFPDTLFLSPNGYHCFIEWKQSKTASRRALQEYWNNRLNSMGHKAFFVSPENIEGIRDEIFNR